MGEFCWQINVRADLTGSTLICCLTQREKCSIFSCLFKTLRQTVCVAYRRLLEHILWLQIYSAQRCSILSAYKVRFIDVILEHYMLKPTADEMPDDDLILCLFL